MKRSKSTTTQLGPRRVIIGSASARARLKRPLKNTGGQTTKSDLSLEEHDVDAAYWQSRADRTKLQARRYRDPAVRDHLMKIAGGYEELARRTRRT
jgi:hypothetical protein